ncbi:MAG: hypothetical protein H0U49_10560 [Parachlamydiaceae bacterium]|nr:hypothetical protein [Parachlamydiaceae bacterium]
MHDDVDQNDNHTDEFDDLMAGFEKYLNEFGNKEVELGNEDADYSIEGTDAEEEAYADYSIEGADAEEEAYADLAKIKNEAGADGTLGEDFFLEEEKQIDNLDDLLAKVKEDTRKLDKKIDTGKSTISTSSIQSDEPVTKAVPSQSSQTSSSEPGVSSKIFKPAISKADEKDLRESSEILNSDKYKDSNVARVVYDRSKFKLYAKAKGSDEIKTFTLNNFGKKEIEKLKEQGVKVLLAPPRNENLGMSLKTKQLAKKIRSSWNSMNFFSSLQGALKKSVFRITKQ